MGGGGDYVGWDGGGGGVGGVGGGGRGRGLRLDPVYGTEWFVKQGGWGRGWMRGSAWTGRQ